MNPPLNEQYYTKDGMLMSHSRFNLNWCEELDIIPKVVLDIGSCDLGDGARFKERFNCLVYSFEPSPKRYEICKKHGDKLNISIFPYAVYSTNGYKQFYPSYDTILKDSGAQGSFYQHTNFYEYSYKHISQQDIVFVPTITIKKFCEEYFINTIDVAHIDVEGSELDVVKGFENIRPKIVFVETLGDNLWNNAPKIEDLMNKMTELDYDLVLDLGTDKLYKYKGI